MTATSGGAALLVHGRVPLRRRRVAEEVLRAVNADDRAVGRWRYVHDTRGPRVALGVVWALLAGAALWAGPVALAVLLAAVAAVAALQTSAALRRAARARWRRSGRASAGHPVPIVAAIAAGVLPLTALASSSVVGAAVLIATAVSIVVAAARLGAPSAVAIADAGETVRAWLVVGLAASAPVVLAGSELALAAVVVGLAATFDVGDYLVGSAATNVVEGPIAGIVGVAVVTFSLAVAQPGTLTADEILQLGIAAAVGCPLGQLLGSALLPRANAFAPAVRRLDSLFLLGPVSLVILR